MGQAGQFQYVADRGGPICEPLASFVHSEEGIVMSWESTLLQRTSTLCGGARVSMVIVAVAASLAFGVSLPSAAHAENPLYCNGEFTLNNGCGEGPHGHIHVNESKNENGGCIADQFWTINFGYIVPVEECGGRVDIYELTHKEESFPRCWNRTNAKNLIHCRYNTW
jgi:hypothetical protein